MNTFFAIIIQPTFLSKVLVSHRANKRISYVLGPVTHEHPGVYTCGIDGSSPDVYVHNWHSLIWVAGQQKKPTDLIYLRFNDMISIYDLHHPQHRHVFSESLHGGDQPQQETVLQW